MPIQPTSTRRAENKSQASSSRKWKVRLTLCLCVPVAFLVVSNVTFLYIGSFHLPSSVFGASQVADASVSSLRRELKQIDDALSPLLKAANSVCDGKTLGGRTIRRVECLKDALLKKDSGSPTSVASTTQTIDTKTKKKKENKTPKHKETQEALPKAEQASAKKLWRDDWACGPRNPLPDSSEPAQCDPVSEFPCCNLVTGWCGHTQMHCRCDGCLDYRSGVLYGPGEAPGDVGGVGGQSAVAAEPIQRDSGGTSGKIPEDNPKVYENNRLPILQDMEYSLPTRVVVLNSESEWLFLWNRKLGLEPPGWEREEFSEFEQWKRIPVPGNWEFPEKGMGYPIYVNKEYPFSANVAAKIPRDYNPVGLYRRSFEVDFPLSDYTVILELGAVSSSVAVFVNGVDIGYSEDSKLPAHFDLSAALKPGANTLALRVVCWSDGAYLEDQDMWWFSGIQRDVRLLLRPAGGFIRALNAQGWWDVTRKEGRLRMAPELMGAKEEGVMLRLGVELIDVKGKTHISEVVRYEQQMPLKTWILSEVQKWSPVEPTTYTLKVRVLFGEVAGDSVSVVVGFRSVEWGGADGLKVNGESLVVRGVNRHEHSALTAHVVSREETVADLVLMKRLGINAIRTSHYPNDPFFYTLCDKMGFLVVSEANIETHGMEGGDTLSVRPKWRSAHLARVTRMIEWLSGHPSIVVWSIGNEAGNGFVMHNAYEAAKRLDPSRPTQYERALISDDRNPPYDVLELNSDLYVPMYPPIDKILEYGRKKRTKALALTPPLIMSEYAHATGNSLGNFAEYWEAIKLHWPRLQGGFIWDFVDQGLFMPFSNSGSLPTSLGELRSRTKEGNFYWGYGGDFGPPNTPSSGHNNCDGIIAADRSFHPSAYEVQKLFATIGVRKVEGGWILEPIFRGETIPWQRYSARVTRECVKGFGSRQNVLFEATDLPSASQKTDAVFVEDSHSLPESEFCLSEADIIDTLEVRLKGDWPEHDLNLGMFPEWTPILPKNHVISWGQSRTVQGYASPPPPQMNGKGSHLLQFEQREEVLWVKAGEHEMTFDLSPSAVTRGLLKDFQISGKKMISQQSFLFRFWRLSVDNDLGNILDTANRHWKTVGQSAHLISVPTVKMIPTGCHPHSCEQVTINYDIDLIDTATLHTTLAFSHRGLYASHTLIAKENVNGLLLPRAGHAFYFRPEASSLVAWYGLGPHETYPDRKTGARQGVHALPAHEVAHSYVRPQENGNREDVHWATLNSGNDDRPERLTFESVDKGFSFSVMRKDIETMGRHEAPKRSTEEYTFVVDGFMSGVGGIDNWGSLPLTKYLLPLSPKQELSWRWNLRF